MNQTQRERWDRASIVMFAVALAMAVALIVAVAWATNVRNNVIRLQAQAAAIQERANLSLEGVIASCNHENAFRVALTYLLNKYPDEEAINLLKNDLEQVPCLSIYPKETQP